jgi:chitin disaccharide deacetylase
LKFIIINADDYGIHEKINEGIIDLLKVGGVNSLSIVASGKAYDQGVMALRAINFKKLGVHLTLVGGEKSITEPKIFTNNSNNRVNSFYIDRFTVFIKTLLYYETAKKEIYEEFNAQIDKVISSGFTISHLDSHQHMHLFPPIAEIVCKLAAEKSIPFIRLPYIDKLNTKEYNILMYAAVNCFAKLLKYKIFRHGLTNIDFRGFNESGKLSSRKLEKILSELSCKYTEIMCHPGKESDLLKEAYGEWGLAWAKEYKALGKIPNIILKSKNEIKYANYEDVRRC